jgi:hypothetical protein
MAPFYCHKHVKQQRANDADKKELLSTVLWKEMLITDRVQERYSEYDSVRRNDIKMLEDEIIDLTGEIAELDASLQTLNRQEPVLEARLGQLRERKTNVSTDTSLINSCLMRIYTLADRYNLEWSLLLGDTPVTPPDSNYPKEVISCMLDMVAKGEGDPLPDLPFQSYFDGCMDMGDMPNLSSLTMSSWPSANLAPSSKRQIHVCDSCHVRQLPLGASVRRAHLDTLIKCSKCRTQLHLCCVEPPLPSVPANAEMVGVVDLRSYSWRCPSCVRLGDDQASDAAMMTDGFSELGSPDIPVRARRISNASSIDSCESTEESSVMLCGMEMLNNPKIPPFFRS